MKIHIFWDDTFTVVIYHLFGGVSHVHLKSIMALSYS